MKAISKKERVATLILCIVLGMLGVHRMYVGKVTSGVVIFILTIFGFTTIISAIWVLIDFIKIITGTFEDGDGAIISNWSNK